MPWIITSMLAGEVTKGLMIFQAVIRTVGGRCWVSVEIPAGIVGHKMKSFCSRLYLCNESAYMIIESPLQRKILSCEFSNPRDTEPLLKAIFDRLTAKRDADYGICQPPQRRQL